MGIDVAKLKELLKIHKEYSDRYNRMNDSYNIFSILKVVKREVPHSAFIANLLDPNGSHGLGSMPLQEFCKVVKIDDGILYECAKVEAEQRTEAGRFMDICITANKIIIIENKIGAKDQPAQLFDYYEEGKKLKKEPSNSIHLFYLTLLGTPPTSDSTRELHLDKYRCISYSKEILAWLEQMLKHEREDNEHIVQYATVKQYRDIINHLTNNNMENMKEVIEKINDNEFKALLGLSESITRLHSAIADNFFSKLHCILQNCPYYDSIDGDGIWLNPRIQTENGNIWFKIVWNDNNPWYAFVEFDKKNSKKQSISENIQYYTGILGLKKESDGNCIYAWQYISNLGFPTDFDKVDNIKKALSDKPFDYMEECAKYIVDLMDKVSNEYQATPK